MTKTNRFTLIATVLLGVLLYTILRFADDLNVAWDGSELEPLPETNNTHQSAQPRIATAMDLRTVLDKRRAEDSIDSAAALDGYSDWSEARGFVGSNRIFSPSEVAPSDRFADMDQAGLIARSEAGDALASQTLAARILFDDPFSAIDLFRRAAEQGSTFALLRIGSLLEALNTVAARNAEANPDQQQRFSDLAKQGVRGSLRLTALGYVVTAIRDGGAPIVDHTLLSWLDRLEAGTTNNELVAACEWSEKTMLDIAGRRIRAGKSPVTTQAPPVFMAIPDLADLLPCARTSYPIENLLELDHCAVTPVRNAMDEDMDLYICRID